MIVDVHMHAHDKHVRDPKMFDPDVYLAEKGEVDLGIIIGMKFKTGSNIPNDHVREMIDRYPGKFAGFCCVWPDDHDAVQDLERSVTQLGLIGLKLSPIYQGFYPHDPKYFPIYRKAVELKVPVAFHTSSSMVSRTSRHIYGDLRYLDEVAIEFPELRIIICHFGYTDYQGCVNLVKKHPNVYTDCSYIPHLAGLDHRMADIRGDEHAAVHFPYHHWVEPMLYNFSTPGEQDKIMFGTDYPGATGVNTLKALRDLPQMARDMGLPPIPEKKVDNIIHENWKRVFKLDGKRGLVPEQW